MLKVFIIVGVATLLSLGAYYGLSKSSITNSIVSNLDLKDYSYVKDFEVKVSAFNDWINKYDKKYSIMELPMKFKVWSDNYDIVEEHNAKNLSWTLETNSFADLTREEHAVLNLGFDQSKMKDFELNIEELEVKPAHKNSVDWRKKGAVSSVKNQQQCGGCWAFAAAAALEGLQKIKSKGTVKNLSAQQLIDCSGSYGNQGCGGGTMVASYQYTQAKGIELDTTYPFIGKQGSCRYSSSKVDFTNKGYKSVPNDYKQLMAAVYLQPVTVAVEADQSAFQMYKSGVISSGCGTNLDHAITAVGYTSTYWIVKNQWGTSWGNQGYVYIAKNSDNVCGINSMASYPTY